MLVAVLLSGGAASTLAAGEEVPQPIIRSEASEEVYSTRAHVEIGVRLLPEGSKRSPHFEWEDELAPAEANGQPPADGSKSWAKAGSGSKTVLEQGGGEVGFQLSLESDGFAQPLTFVHHLQPSTVYYARFHVKDEGGTAEETFKFETLPVTKPEIEGQNGTGTGGVNSSTLGVRAHAAGPFAAKIEPILQANGADTEYEIDVAPAEAGITPPPEGSSAWVPVSAGGSGHLSVEEESVQLKASTAGLSPETFYFARLKAVNHCNHAKPSEECTLVVTEPFQTPTAKPSPGEPEIRNVTGTSAHVLDSVNPYGSETKWSFETAPAPGGPWTPASGAHAQGTVSRAEAEALLKADTEGSDITNAEVEATLTGLQPNSTYYLRLFASSAAGEGVVCHEGAFLPGTNTTPVVCEPLSVTTRNVRSLHTNGAPTATAFATHTLRGQAVRLLGDVNPNSAPTSAEQVVALEGVPSSGSFTLSFEGQTTAAIAYDASAEEVAQALRALSTIGSGVNVTGPVGGRIRSSSKMLWRGRRCR